MILRRKTFAVALGLAILMAASASTPTATAQSTEATLPDAVRRALVEVAVCGMGASTGAAIIMAIRSRAGYPLRVKVPSGTVLRSRNAGAQDMIVHRVEGKHRETARDIFEKCLEVARHEDERSKRNEGLSQNWLQQDSIVLQPNQSSLYLLSAYCLDFEKGNPSPSTSFNVADQSGSETTQLFRYLEQHPRAFNIVAIQLATWAANENRSAAKIATTFGFDAQDRIDACRLLNAAGINAQRKALCN